MNRSLELVVAITIGVGIGIVLGSFLMGGAVSSWFGDQPRRTVPEAVPLESDEEEQPVETKIMGSGVERPGTYKMDADSEVVDLIDQAGGLTEDAILRDIPWHESLYEGFSLSVPTEEVLKEVAEGDRTLQTEDLMYFRGDLQSHAKRVEPEEEEDTININEAPRSDLEELYGVGPGLAGRIIQHREEEGPFKRPRDIMKVPGIGEVTFQQMRPNIEI